MSRLPPPPSTRAGLRFLRHARQRLYADRCGHGDLADIRQKPAMDSVWIDWVGPEENWPQRACVGVDLYDDCLIEVVATAKVLVTPQKANIDATAIAHQRARLGAALVAGLGDRTIAPDVRGRHFKT